MMIVPTILAILADGVEERQRRGRLREIESRLGLTLQANAGASARIEWISKTWGEEIGKMVRSIILTVILDDIEAELPTRTRYDPLLVWLAREIVRAGQRSVAAEEPIYDTRGLAALARVAAGEISLFSFQEGLETVVTALPLILDWFDAEGPNITPMSWDEAMLAQVAWHRSFAPAAEGLVPGIVVHRFDDGWTIQQLTKRKQLDAEGRVLRHCVGSYWSRVAEGRSKIFSLRDSLGKARITIEVLASGPSEGEMSAALGYLNRPANPEELQRINAWRLPHIGEALALLRERPGAIPVGDGWVVVRLAEDDIPLLRAFGMRLYLPSRRPLVQHSFILFSPEGAPQTVFYLGPSGRAPSSRSFFSMTFPHQGSLGAIAMRNEAAVAAVAATIPNFPLPQWGRKFVELPSGWAWYVIDPENVPASSATQFVWYGEMMWLSGWVSAIRALLGDEHRELLWLALRNENGLPMEIVGFDLFTQEVAFALNRANRKKGLYRKLWRPAVEKINEELLSGVREIVPAQTTPLPTWNKGLEQALWERIQRQQRGTRHRRIEREDLRMLRLGLEQARRFQKMYGLPGQWFQIHLSGGAERATQSDPQDSTEVRWGPKLGPGQPAFEVLGWSVTRTVLKEPGFEGSRYLPRLIVRTLLPRNVLDEQRRRGERKGSWWVLRNEIIIPSQPGTSKRFLRELWRTINMANIRGSKGTAIDFPGYRHPRVLARGVVIPQLRNFLWLNSEPGHDFYAPGAIATLSTPAKGPVPSSAGFVMAITREAQFRGLPVWAETVNSKYVAIYLKGWEAPEPGAGVGRPRATRIPRWLRSEFLTSDYVEENFLNYVKEGLSGSLRGYLHQAWLGLPSGSKYPVFSVEKGGDQSTSYSYERFLDLIQSAGAPAVIISEQYQRQTGRWGHFPIYVQGTGPYALRNMKTSETTGGVFETPQQAFSEVATRNRKYFRDIVENRGLWIDVLDSTGRTIRPPGKEGIVAMELAWDEE